MMYNVLYIHGFNSFFDENSEKIIELKKHFNLFGLSLNYSELSYHEVYRLIYNELVDKKIDCIIGTSFGGWLANNIGGKCGLPFVCINPVINPIQTLEKYSVKEEIIESYQNKSLYYKNGMLLLDMGDEVLDSNKTLDHFQKYLLCRIYDGGNHRFVHMKESIEDIVNFIAINEIILEN